MDKREFLDKLQKALASGVSSSQVADNVRYYQDYIESEIRKGKSEAEVLDGLGDPRLLAKSIIEANKRAGASYGSNQEYDEEVVQEDSRDYGRGFGGHFSGGHGLVLPGWLVMVIATVVIILMIGVATSLLSVLSPVILVVLIVLLIVKVFQSNTK